MHTLRSRIRLTWLGILLVLMPLIAPTISHAIVRAAVLQGGDGIVALSLLESSVCSPVTAQAADEGSPAEPVRHAQAACDYCSLHPGLATGPAWVDVTVHAPEDGPLALAFEPLERAQPRLSAHGARAPPARVWLADPARPSDVA